MCGPTDANRNVVEEEGREGQTLVHGSLFLYLVGLFFWEAGLTVKTFNDEYVKFLELAWG